MQISTNEFLLGSLGDLLTQESNLSQLNRQIATGETMLDPSDDPAGAGQAIDLAGAINRLSYDAGNAQAATQDIQSGLSVLQQVSSLINQLRQVAVEGANGTNSAATQSALVTTAQSALQELVQLANSQDAEGNYIFAGTKTNAPPFASLANGQVVFTGDNGGNLLEIAPSVTVAAAVSGENIFANVPAGENGVAVTAAAANIGTAYVTVKGITGTSQLNSARLSGTQYEIVFSAGVGGTLNYTVTGGIGAPGSAGFISTSSTVASGSYTTGSDLQFGGLDIGITGPPAAGDQFFVNPAGTSSLFQTIQGLISALGSASSTPQQIQNAIVNLDGAQTSILSAQATLGSNLAEIQGVQAADSTASTNDQAQLSTLQSANLPQAIANYSAGVTALQAAELVFSKIQNLSLFSVIQ
ncbi:MAG: flagellar hook-associated protein FlgL [Alphaproteobacteria bacterium]|nr:flagellar hook-associated protein FlgL [Alphaproteobacteria bacterium]